MNSTIETGQPELQLIKQPRLTRRIGRSRTDDHEKQMTSLVILVISVFE